jgi:hypothetical protein
MGTKNNTPEFSKDNTTLLVDGEKRIWASKCRVPFSFHVRDSVYKKDINSGVLTSRAVPVFDDLPLAPEDEPWSFETEDKKDILDSGDDGYDNWDLYKSAHSWYDPEMLDVQAGYKLPIAKIYNGSLHVYWSGVVAAMAALNGARGGVDIPNEDKESVYNYLSKYYEKFDKEPPAMRSKNIGVANNVRAKEGDVVLEGTASTTSVDWHGTEMSLKALQEMSTQFNKGVPYLPSHGDDEWDQVMGMTFESKISRSDNLAKQQDGEEGYELNVKTLLYGDDDKVKELMRRVDRGQKIGWSIGGWFTDMQFVENSQSEEIERIIVKGVELDHLATTRKPSNPDTWISQLSSAIRSKERVASYGGVSIGSIVYWDGGYGEVVEVFLGGTIYEVENGPYEVELHEPVARVRIYEKSGDTYIVTDRYIAIPVEELSVGQQPMLASDEGGPAMELSQDSLCEQSNDKIDNTIRNDTESVVENNMYQKTFDTSTDTEQNSRDNDARRSASNNKTIIDEVTMSESETNIQPDNRLEELEERFSLLERSISTLVDTLNKKEEVVEKEVVVEVEDNRSAEMEEMKKTISNLESNLKRATTKQYSRRAFAHRGGAMSVEVPKSEVEYMIEAARSTGNGSVVNATEGMKDRLCSKHNTSFRQAQYDLRSILMAAAEDGILHVPNIKNTDWR